MSWIKERLEEKQVVLEQEWLRDSDLVERQPARNLEEAWFHMVAAVERDVKEYNALKLCGHRQINVTTGPDSLQLQWHDYGDPILNLRMDHTGEVINYSIRTGKGDDQPRHGTLRIRLRRGSNAILYNGRPSPFTYEEASQLLLQPLLMP